MRLFDFILLNKYILHDLQGDALMAKLLSIQNLDACAGEKRILAGVSLDIDSGEIHVLMGPNGAGKSTLGFVLMGSPEYTVTGGSILFEGEDVTLEAADKRARRGIFLSFQEPLEVPGVSLESFVRTSVQQVTGRKVKLMQFAHDLERAMELLDMDKSYCERDLNVGFSGGEKKKAEILQLLMLCPKLAVLDETDSGLDVDACRVVSRGIKEYMQRSGGSLLIITHSARILENLVQEHLTIDATHVMVKGRIVKTGDGSLAQRINEVGFDEFVPQEVKDEQRKERLALAAKAAMESVKAMNSSGTRL